MRCASIVDRPASELIFPVEREHPKRKSSPFLELQMDERQGSQPVRHATG